MSTLEDGQIFERYRIIRWLGSGVSGESYEAEDTMLLRKVTLKLLHPWSTLPDSARRQFFREMQGISMLNHPYLASVLDYGEIDARLYVARRFVSSGSLLGNDGRLWFRPPLNVPDAIGYAHQMAQVLQYIHNHGCLHGAITFSNILVLRGPNVEKQTDYAPFLLADVGLTNYVRRFGQPQNPLLPITAAPEQLGKRVVPASDQFALAVLLYFWLTGRPPYLGTPDEIEQLKLTETITPLHSLNLQVTSEQDAIVRRALAVYPEDRYSSILAFTDTLLATLTPKFSPMPDFEPITQPELTASVEPTSTEVEAAQFELITTSEPEFEFVEAAQFELTTSTEPDYYFETETETQAAPFVESEPELASQMELMPITETEQLTYLETTTVPEFETIPQTDPVFFTEPEAEGVIEPENISIAEPATTDETEDIPVTEPTSEDEPASVIEPANDSEPGLPAQSEPTAVFEPEAVPQFEYEPPTTPEPTSPTIPDPVPQTEPDVPQPMPEPDVPLPVPDPIPQPAPDIPETPPEPDVPLPAPDPIPQPVPDVPQTLPEPQAPQTTPQILPQAEISVEETPASIQEVQPEVQDEPSVITARLIITSPYTEEPYEVVLEGDETTLGRAGSSDILLDHDNLTSRHHALLKYEDDHYVLYDRRSANGVFVNGQQITADTGYQLEDGDHISIGNYELIFRFRIPMTSGVGAPAEETSVTSP